MLFAFAYDNIRCSIYPILNGVSFENPSLRISVIISDIFCDGEAFEGVFPDLTPPLLLPIFLLLLHILLDVHQIMLGAKFVYLGAPSVNNQIGSIKTRLFQHTLAMKKAIFVERFFFLYYFPYICNHLFL